MTDQSLRIDSTLSCVLIGVLFAVMFYGCSCAQVMYYFREYPRDKTHTKILVVVLWLLNSAGAFLAAIMAWRSLVQNHGDFKGFFNIPPIFPAEALLTALVIFIAQSYYINVIWTLLARARYRKSLTFVMAFVALFSFVCGLPNVYQGFHTHTVPAAFVNSELTVNLQLISACATDVGITVVLSAVLNEGRSGKGRTDQIIRRLICQAFRRGTCTAASQILNLVTYSAFPKTMLYWLIFHFLSGKLYVNSVFAVLNSRHLIVHDGETHMSHGFHFSDEFLSESALAKTPTLSRANALVPEHSCASAPALPAMRSEIEAKAAGSLGKDSGCELARWSLSLSIEEIDRSGTSESVRGRADGSATLP